MDLLAQMEEAHTRRFLTQLFASYYRNPTLDLPPRFDHREWGFISWGEGGMRRHLRFNRQDQLSAHLAGSTPAHAYHSVAYYRHPEAARMADKVWLGADLVFDLDADHLPTPPGTPFPQLMQQTLRETEKLVHEFLLGDLGLSRRHLWVYFSGGRGYHIHVRDPRLRGLDSQARREIVDYIIAQGLEVGPLLVPRVRSLSQFKGLKRTRVLEELPRPEAPGWAGRLTRNLMTLMAGLDPQPELAPARKVRGDDPPAPDPAQKVGPAETSSASESAVVGANRRRRAVVDRLQQVKGVGPKTARAMAELVLEGASYHALWQAAPQPLKDHWLDKALSLGRGHTDEPVTTDIHRLIRLPGSLHGGTGLAVVPLDLDDMGGFDPYELAVVFDDRPVRIRVVERPGQVQLKGELYAPSPHEVLELPCHAAVYLLCRRWAKLALSPREAA